MQDLLRVQMKKIQSKKVQTTEEWLRNYSVESLQLTLKHLINEGNIILNSRNGVEEIELTEEIVTNFESRLSEVIELYHQRIQWLLQNSRKVFGLIKGTKVGLMVDVSHMSYGPRLLDFQKDLLCLIDEQLCYKKQLYCLSFSTEISPLWESPKNINVRVLQEARQWIQQLEPGQGCNLLKALKDVLTMKELNSLVLIVGSCPDQTLETLSDYAQQRMLGRKLQTHAVTYDCSNPASLAVLKNLAEALRGCYHCYSSKGENFDSSDVHLLLQEAQKAKDLLKSIKQIFQRRIGGSLISRIADVSTEFADTAPSSFLPKPPKHKGPLVIQSPCVLAKTSTDWLKTNGLKAKKLNLYQVLAPNAFSPVEEFVPILKKTVSSTLHEKAMTQFEWYDGTVKNIHVDLPVLYNYQKLLAKTVRIYEKRIDWLSVASRRIWGSVCETRVVILLDISVTNSTYIIHIQHSLRLLLEEQMSNKDYFNIIAFGSDVVPWQLELVPSQPENLENAWRWVLGLQCKGSRNFMSALRRAVEVDFKDKDKHKSQGLYLLTTGIPDQETGVVKHLQFQPKELEIYTEQLEKLLQRYIERIQWLLSGSRRLFGTILEANVCVVIDTSGSMDPYLPHIMKELTSLIWEQLRKNEVRFNLLRFAEDTESWKECLVEATDETCHDAVQWVSKFHAYGNTCILMALKKALSFQGIEALYVLTDGKPDTSGRLILKEIEGLRKKQDIKIHTISFSRTDRRANEFLKKLASQTGGRYHRSFGDADEQLAAHRMLTEGLDDEDDPVFPYFEGDDLKKLTQEAAKARSFLKQSKSLRTRMFCQVFRLLLKKWNINQKDDSGF
ncbi:von Willebrand factor A domain-containing protein 3A isoform X12 [Chroicocephalus ridibundus]|uniref:von Willebrand factor A domain-containing protein 3A isoform X12 n=1 Tax=Chroicocephalus ridibundus TaxID=1192867 RepID=UPI002FDCABFE